MVGKGWRWDEVGPLHLGARLGSLAHLAGADIGLYVFLHLGPPILL